MLTKAITFALLTGLCWGFYGSALAPARAAIGPKQPYLGITAGYIAFCLLVIIVPMGIRGELPSFSGPGLKGLSWGTAAGLLGAAGAYFLTLSMISGGGRTPHVVMALVFGTAVSIAAIVGYIQTRAEATSNPILWVGIVGMIVCAIVVAYNTPHKHPAKPTTQQTVAAAPPWQSL